MNFSYHPSCIFNSPFKSGMENHIEHSHRCFYLSYLLRKHHSTGNEIENLISNISKWLSTHNIVHQWSTTHTIPLWVRDNNTSKGDYKLFPAYIDFSNKDDLFSFKVEFSIGDHNDY